MNRSLTGKWVLCSYFLRLLREPMQSWMMKLWLNNHDESERPDLPIYQPEGACHVTRAEEHPSKDVIEKMCSESFFTHHKYLYVESIQRSVAGTVDEDQYEFRESPDISQSLHQGSSVSHQSPRESLASVGLSRDRSSKFGQGQQTVAQGGETIESRDYYYSYPAVEEMFGEERGCSMSQPEDAISDHEQYELCESPHISQSSRGSSVNDISENNEGGVDVEDGPKHDLRLENNTAYKELDKTNQGYMPLSIEQRTGEQPCFITSDTKKSSTPLPQYGGNDSSAEFYSCVDLLVQGPHQGQEDERFSSGPINSTEIFQNMEYKLKYDSNEDMAIQKLLKDAEFLYQDIVQGRKKSVRK